MYRNRPRLIYSQCKPFKNSAIFLTFLTVIRLIAVDEISTD